MPGSGSVKLRRVLAFAAVVVPLGRFSARAQPVLVCSRLNAQEERTLRSLVHDHRTVFVAELDSYGHVHHLINVPQELDLLYAKSPVGVLETLREIVADARPEDAKNAIEFALVATIGSRDVMQGIPGLVDVGKFDGINRDDGLTQCACG